MSGDERARSWWRTGPGALKTIAALAAAVTALVVALNQIGVRDDELATSGVVEPSGAAGTTGGWTAYAFAGPAYRAAFPEGTRATFSTSAIEVLGSRVERGSADELVLTVWLRMTNTSGKPAGFWRQTSRLLVDGDARTPVDAMNELELADGAVTFPQAEAAADASADGAVTFALPEAADDLALELRHAGEEARLPIELRRG